MLKIRLQRVGKKHEPVFRVVVGKSQNGPKSGKFIEILGSYDPRDKNANTLNKEKVTAWIAKGAQVSDTVHNLLVSEKVIDKKKVNALPKKTAPKKEVVAEEKAPEAPKAEVAPEEVVETPAEEVITEEAATEVSEESPKVAESSVEAESIEDAPEVLAEEGSPELAIEDEDQKEE